MPEIHQFLDGFYLSRIGIRMLAGQHIALHEPPKAAHIGLIATKCSPWQVGGFVWDGLRRVLILSGARGCVGRYVMTVVTVMSVLGAHTPTHCFRRREIGGTPR